MSYHYQITCDGCGEGLNTWDDVPPDWATIRTSIQERERHLCPTCFAKFDKDGKLRGLNA